MKPEHWTHNQGGELYIQRDLEHKILIALAISTLVCIIAGGIFVTIFTNRYLGEQVRHNQALEAIQATGSMTIIYRQEEK
jgi:hypothetical protein